MDCTLENLTTVANFSQILVTERQNAEIRRLRAKLAELGERETVELVFTETE